MLQTWSVEDVREAEATVAASLPDGELMQRAAKGLAKVVRARIGAQETPCRVVGLIGSGGNGGDTLYALARVARKDIAAGVAAVLLSRRGVHEEGLAEARRRGVQIVDALTQTPAAHETVAVADLLLDGITGIGGRPGWDPDLAELIEALLDEAPADAHLIAVDLPSGADPAGMTTDSPGVWADETVTFGVPKPVHALATAPRCGTLTVVDIGLDLTTPACAERLEYDDIPALWPVPGPEDDKYSRGVLGIVAGGEKYTGAALLSVTAAVTAGAGMVRYVGTPTPTSLVRARIPEAVIGAPTGDQRVQAWVVGPGLDAHETRNKAAASQLAAARDALHSTLPCVVDAGGLDLLEGPRPGAGARTLLTPHAGELSRLLSRLGIEDATRESVAQDPIGSAQRAADALHATVLLKGHTTYIVPPPSSGLPLRAQSEAPAWAATAGSGDVLAGLAGVLLAAGNDPLEAGSAAALVHGLACAQVNPGGPVRALAVAEQLGVTIAGLLSRH